MEFWPLPEPAILLDTRDWLHYPLIVQALSPRTDNDSHDPYAEWVELYHQALRKCKLKHIQLALDEEATVLYQHKKSRKENTDGNKPEFNFALIQVLYKTALEVCEDPQEKVYMLEDQAQRMIQEELEARCKAAKAHLRNYDTSDTFAQEVLKYSTSSGQKLTHVLRNSTSACFQAKEALSDRLAEEGLYEEEVPGDNNCQFHSLAAQMKQKGNCDYDAKKLRDDAVEYIQEHAQNDEEMKEQIDACYGYTLEKYCEEMGRHNVTWGDEFTLWAQSKMLCHNIRVIKDPVARSYPDPPWSQHPTLTIAHYHEYHYSSTLPLLGDRNLKENLEAHGVEVTAKAVNKGQKKGWICKIDGNTFNSLKETVKFIAKQNPKCQPKGQVKSTKKDTTGVQGSQKTEFLRSYLKREYDAIPCIVVCKGIRGELSLDAKQKPTVKCLSDGAYRTLGKFAEHSGCRRKRHFQSVKLAGTEQSLDQVVKKESCEKTKQSLDQVVEEESRQQEEENAERPRKKAKRADKQAEIGDLGKQLASKVDTI